MNKIGLSINSAQSGINSIHVVNSGEWIKKVRDLREDLKMISFPADRDAVACLMSFDEKGCYLCMARKIGGRQGDYTAAWLFVPREISVPGNGLEAAVNFAVAKISGSRIEKGELDEYFSKEYPGSRVAAAYPAVKSDRLAYRYYGTGTLYTALAQLLDPKVLYQSFYSEYRAVFLIDKASGIDVAGQGMADLTDKFNKEMMVLNPPVGLPAGCYAQVNGVQFAAPICATKGEQVRVQFRRMNYDPVEKEIIVLKDNEAFPTPGVFNWEKTISSDLFQVVDEKMNPIERFSLKVNDQRLLPGGSVKVSESLLPASRIEVEAEGYEPLRTTVDLNSAFGYIQLTRKMEEYTIVIPSRPGLGRGEFKCSLPVQGELKESPIEGYRIDGEGQKVIHLRYDPMAVVKRIPVLVALIVAALVLVGIGFGAGLLVGGGEKNKPKVEQPASAVEQPAEQPAKEATDPGVVEPELDDVGDNWAEEMLAEEVAYLDGHEKWSRTEMNRIGGRLPSVFEALNIYAFDVVENFDFPGSQNWVRLKAAVKTAKQNGWKPNRWNYCDPSDETITLSKYIETITAAPRSEANPRKKETRKTDPRAGSEDRRKTGGIGGLK